MTTTDRDITAQVTAAIEANGAELAAGIRTDAVVAEIIDTYGLVDVETIEHDAFWAIVERHDASA